MRVDPLQVLTKLAAAQNIPTRRVTPPFDGLEEFDYGLRRSLDPQFDWQEFGRLLLEQTPAQTLLFVEGTFELHFALFRIPDEENTVFLVGPWTFGPRSEKARKWARRYLGEAGENAVQEYYNGVKLLQANDFYMTIRVLVGMMMGEDLVVKELKEFLPFCFHPDVRYFNEPKFQKDIPISMLEQRYESENRILDAVVPRRRRSRHRGHAPSLPLHLRRAVRRLALPAEEHDDRLQHPAAQGHRAQQGAPLLYRRHLQQVRPHH